jgi:histone-lysine N-methyltransferase SETMAR
MERFDQLIHANRRIMTRELCTELNVSSSGFETILATLEYHKVCARWVPQMLTQEHKDHQMQVCQDLLNHYEAEGDSFLDCIITSDEKWYQHYEPESKQQPMEW